MGGGGEHRTRKRGGREREEGRRREGGRGIGWEEGIHGWRRW